MRALDDASQEPLRVPQNIMVLGHGLSSAAFFAVLTDAMLQFWNILVVDVVADLEGRARTVISRIISSDSRSRYGSRHGIQERVILSRPSRSRLDSLQGPTCERSLIPLSLQRFAGVRTGEYTEDRRFGVL